MSTVMIVKGGQTNEFGSFEEIQAAFPEILVNGTGAYNIIEIGSDIGFGKNAKLQLIFNGNNNKVTINDNVF